MWLFTKSGFVSIVQHRDAADMMIVRARFRGDAARFARMKVADEKITPMADYRYRVIIGRARLAELLALEVDRLDYPNFKDSLAVQWRKNIAMAVWRVLERAQQLRVGMGQQP